jgi:hypothetical protein
MDLKSGQAAAADAAAGREAGRLDPPNGVLASITNNRRRFGFTPRATRSSPTADRRLPTNDQWPLFLAFRQGFARGRLGAPGEAQRQRTNNRGLPTTNDERPMAVFFSISAKGFARGRLGVGRGERARSLRQDNCRAQNDASNGRSRIFNGIFVVLARGMLLRCLTASISTRGHCSQRRGQASLRV